MNDYVKCPTCGGTGGTERVETVWHGSTPYPQHVGEPCEECHGEGYVEAPADENEAAVAAE